MTSKEIYDDFRAKIQASGNIYIPEKAQSYAHRVIERIADEILQPPYLLENSAFIMEVQNELTRFCADPQGGKISVDLYAITISLYEYISSGRDFTKCGTCDSYTKSKTLFNNTSYTGRNAQKCMRDLQECLEHLDAYYLKTSTLLKVISTLNSPENTPAQTHDSYSSDAVHPEDEKITLVTSSPAKSTPAPSQRQPKPSSSPIQPPKLAQSEEQRVYSASSVRTEQERQAEQERVAGMVYDDNAKIKEWHEAQKGFLDEMRKIQPDLRDALKKITSFSDKITEEYVLRFAESYVRLYNLIHDGVMHHRESAERSCSLDYRRAVKNFEVYRSAVIRDLAAFGVEEIKTKPGSRFDGEIHKAADAENFDSMRARVRESVRSGFRYNSIIIQKEEVNIGG